MAKSPDDPTETILRHGSTDSAARTNTGPNMNTGAQPKKEIGSSATDHPEGPRIIGQDGDQGVIVNADDMHEGLLPTKKKKKRSKKPASKRGLGKPTGFEEYHADGPLTPEDYAESQEAFHPDIPFVDRILRAIQRFERTRKLSPERRDVFYKYLVYGGIDVGPNMFIGAQNTEDMDKDQINAALAQASISEDTKHQILDPKADNKIPTTESASEGSKLRSAEHLAKYIVDFEGTMRAFLSRYASTLYAFDTKDQVRLITTTLERFMDYLLQHDVCPEYTTEVLNTRNLCRAAGTQLWQCAESQRLFPGDFNIACSTLFGGSYSRNYDGETQWAPSEPGAAVFIGLKPEQATQIVGFAIAGAAGEDVYVKYLDITTGESAGAGFEVINTITDHGFEITHIEPPTQECRDLYRENTSEFQPVGRVYAKFFKNPDALPEDLTAAERAVLKPSNPDLDTDTDTDLYDDEFTFFIEPALIELLCPGMRVEATVYELNCGIWFFDEVTRVLPPFDLWIENELMVGWKEPSPVAGAIESAWNLGGDYGKPESGGVKPDGIGDVGVSQDGHGENGNAHAVVTGAVAGSDNGMGTGNDSTAVVPTTAVTDTSREGNDDHNNIDDGYAH